MFRAFDHLVEPCSILLSLVQWSLIAIRLFTGQILTDSTFLLFLEMLSVVQAVRAQWVIVSAKFSLVQQNVQHVWPPSNWTSLNNAQICWTNVQPCSVKVFSTFGWGVSLRFFSEKSNFCWVDPAFCWIRCASEDRFWCQLRFRDQLVANMSYRRRATYWVYVSAASRFLGRISSSHF